MYKNLAQEFPITAPEIQHIPEYCGRTVASGAQISGCAMKFSKCSRLSIITSTEDLVLLFDAARRTNLRILLPTILLICCMQETNALCNAINACGLSSADEKMFRDIQLHLGTNALTRLQPLYAKGSLRCRMLQGSSQCQLRSLDALRMLFFPFWSTMVGTQLCAACLSNFWESPQRPHTSVVQEWSQLPSLLGLPTWEKLQNETDDLWKEVRRRDRNGKQLCWLVQVVILI